MHDDYDDDDDDDDDDDGDDVDDKMMMNWVQILINSRKWLPTSS